MLPSREALCVNSIASLYYLFRGVYMSLCVPHAWFVSPWKCTPIAFPLAMARTNQQAEDHNRRCIQCAPPFTRFGKRSESSRNDIVHMLTERFEISRSLPIAPDVCHGPTGRQPSPKQNESCHASQNPPSLPLGFPCEIQTAGKVMEQRACPLTTPRLHFRRHARLNVFKLFTVLGHLHSSL